MVAGWPDPPGLSVIMAMLRVVIRVTLMGDAAARFIVERLVHMLEPIVGVALAAELAGVMSPPVSDTTTVAGA